MLAGYDGEEFGNKSEFIHDKFNSRLNPMASFYHLVQNPFIILQGVCHGKCKPGICRVTVFVAAQEGAFFNNCFL
jgi:hypothetical protein